MTGKDRKGGQVRGGRGRSKAQSQMRRHKEETRNGREGEHVGGQTALHWQYWIIIHWPCWITTCADIKEGSAYR